MSILVQKYGGTSVGTIERIKSVAKRIKTSVERADNIVIVVSAMAGVTNQLISYANNLNSYEGDREYDVVVSAGEQISAGLISMALKDLGLNAKSYLAWQLPIRTDNSHGQANICSISTDAIREDIRKSIIPVICGFQGVCENENCITTIGRGGSDLTAVSVAAALNAEMCEIYSDVDGIYTADPNKISSAKLIKNINYKEMLEMSLNGAKVLQAKSVNYAMQKNVAIRAASSFINSTGTLVSGNKSFDSQIVGVCTSDHLVYFNINFEQYEQTIKLLDDNYIRAVFSEKDDNKYTITISKSCMRIVSDILTLASGKKNNVQFKISQYMNVSVVGLGIGNDEDILSIIKVQLTGIKINKIILLENSINITILKKDEMEVVSTLHNTFIG